MNVALCCQQSWWLRPADYLIHIGLWLSNWYSCTHCGGLCSSRWLLPLCTVHLILEELRRYIHLATVTATDGFHWWTTGEWAIQSAWDYKTVHTYKCQVLDNIQHWIHTSSMFKQNNLTTSSWDLWVKSPNINILRSTDQKSNQTTPKIGELLYYY